MRIPNKGSPLNSNIDIYKTTIDATCVIVKTISLWAPKDYNKYNY